jgi:ketosteroid isomerase-like protein
LRTATDANIALVNHGLAAFSRGDFDAAVVDMHPDIEWHVAFQLPDMPPDKTVYVGPEEIRRLWAAFRSAWERLTVDVEEVLEDSDDLVVVRARFVGKAGDSGIEVDRLIFYVFELSGGKLKRLRPFDTEAEAVAAARS